MKICQTARKCEARRGRTGPGQECAARGLRRRFDADQRFDDARATFRINGLRPGDRAPKSRIADDQLPPDPARQFRPAGHPCAEACASHRHFARQCLPADRREQQAHVQAHRPHRRQPLRRGGEQTVFRPVVARRGRRHARQAQGRANSFQRGVGDHEQAGRGHVPRLQGRGRRPGRDRASHARRRRRRHSPRHRRRAHPEKPGSCNRRPARPASRRGDPQRQGGPGQRAHRPRRLGRLRSHLAGQGHARGGRGRQSHQDPSEFRQGRPELRRRCPRKNSHSSPKA